MSTDSLKMLWRVTRCSQQARLASPSLTLHTLPTLKRCQLRFANHLSEHTGRSVSNREHRSQGFRPYTSLSLWDLCDSVRDKDFRLLNFGVSHPPVTSLSPCLVEFRRTVQLGRSPLLPMLRIACLLQRLLSE